MQNDPFDSGRRLDRARSRSRNARLMAFAQDRRPYLYTETLVGSKATGHIAPLILDSAATLGR